MSSYYVIEASFGPRVEQSVLRYGPIEASDPKNAIHIARFESTGYGHLRVEVFPNEESYRRRERPVAVWENTEALRLDLAHKRIPQEKFEAFFVTPLPSSPQ